MAESSSDSDHVRHRIGRRGPVRATRTRNHGVEDVTEKIHTLASTLQDTNRNLRNVDQMLGQYREYNNEQAEAIANLKETLEQSIGQLRSQRLLRNSGERSASLSSLYASDLDSGAPEGRHFQPTSPLKDYGETVGARRYRSRSAVQFVDRGDNGNQLHSLHQSLRDLSSEQVRLEDDLSRELSRRNRTDAETKRRLEDLCDRLNESQTQETVSERVERRLQKIGQEIRSERQLVERRQDQLGHMSVHLQEALKQQDAKSNEAEVALKSKIFKMEGEKSKLEQDLERSRRKLDQSENSREVLLHQIEDLRSQLLRAEEERLNLQHQISQVAIHQNHPDEQENDRRKRREAERSDPEKKVLEKEIWELRAKLNHSAVMSEIEELKRCMERKDKERAQLGMQMEALKEKDDLKSQLLSTMHQMESLQKELTDVLEKRAKQEEELHCREVKLNESRSQQIALEQEIRDIRETADKLNSELQKQSLTQSQIQTDKQHLEEELATINMIHEKEQARLLEMQAVIKNLSGIRAELTSRVAEEEKSKKEMHKTLTELQKQQESSQEEMAAVTKQLKLERDVHQHELAELQSELQRVKTNHDQRVQEMMELFSQEKEEAASHIGMLKAELVEERNLVKAHRRQVEKMKIECDKLTEELTQKEEENVKCRRKYQLMKQELDERHKRLNSEDDHLRRVEEDRLQLHDQLRSLQNEKESILSMIGSEIDAACEVLSRDSVEKYTAISLTPGVQNDPHRWLAETKTKLRWLCEEVKERESKEKKLRHQLLQSREQLKQLTLSKEMEHQNLIGQIEKQEQLLKEVYQEKKDLLEKSLRKEEEIGDLQERITALETSTRVALDHLESVPEKLNFLEDSRDLGDSHNQTEIVAERCSKYKEIMGSLQQHLEESKRRLEDFRDKKTGADISAIQSASCNWRTNTSFMSSSLLSNSGSFTKSTIPLDLNTPRKGATSLTVNGVKLRTEKEKN
ncbi:centrosomal protein of 128 kDa isoform X5 [Sceloporus undulatus]|uniref:centrosomal protein of 128 kDa isoform X5 n=1 Tax=Sceloporus undulatus TaxID=8520 RepID=UPI001C4BDD14|nr:centrosomal protein of 128 kDa isoform X5 [Sceloporus undulatus]